MTAPADWLTDPRPPAPFRETPVIFEAMFADRFAAAVREDDPVSGDLFDPPTVQFRKVQDGLVLRFGRWVRRNLNAKRVIAGGASGLVLAITALGSWLQ